MKNHPERKARLHLIECMFAGHSWQSAVLYGTMKLYKIFSFLKSNNSVQKNNSRRTQGVNGSPPFPSLNVAFDLTRELLAAQLERVDTLDTKANFALGAATALVSAALVLQSLLLPSNSHSICAMLVPGFLDALPLLVNRALPVLPLLVAYLCVIITATLAYKIRDYKQVPTPRKLLDSYLNEPEDRTKAKLFRAMVEAYEGNELEIKKKTAWIDRAFVALVVEVVMLILLLLFQVIC